MDLIGHGFNQSLEEGRSDVDRGALFQTCEGELRGSIDGHEELELALGRLDLGDIDMETADRMTLELPLRRCVALQVRQT